MSNPRSPNPTPPAPALSHEPDSDYAALSSQTVSESSCLLEVLASQPHPSGEEVRRVERLVRAEIVRMSRLVR